jgi:predicted RNA-binding Zn ribbon-like protein
MTSLTDDAELIGGHAALDLVNTVAWRGDPARIVDRLVDLPTLLAWMTRVGLLDAASGGRLARERQADGEAALRAARRVRETLHTALHATATGTPLSSQDVADLRSVLVGAVRRASLDSTLPLRWTITPRLPEDLAWQLALVGMELLHDSDRLHAVRVCQGIGCGWLFIDQSRSHTRRWCSSADCGNRERARRHYARTRSVDS